MLLLPGLGKTSYVLLRLHLHLFLSKKNVCINAIAFILNRHCLWILGNERTLVSQENVWKTLVLDAKKRQCFFNADEDKDLAKAIWDARKELDQLDDLLNANSVIFRNSRWKVFGLPI
jgi:hypothetical protein